MHPDTALYPNSEAHEQARASAASLAEWVVVLWVPVFLPLRRVKKPDAPSVMEGKGEEHRAFRHPLCRRRVTLV